MAELHSNLYFNHPKPKTHKALIKLFKALSSDEEKALDIAFKIQPNDGSDLLDELLDDIDDKYGDSLQPESVEKVGDYCRVHLVNGGSGDFIVGCVLKFLYELSPDIHAQAWGCGDDDPWEYWFKYKDGRVIRSDDEPLEDDEEDAYIKGTVYRWWHESMPVGIQEGLLNHDESDEEDNESQIDLDAKLPSDTEYEEWLAKLYQKSEASESDDLIAQGIAPAMSGEEVKDMVESISDLFSMFKGVSKASSNPQENAFDANEVSEDLVMQAFEDLEKEEVEFNLDGILKHFSKKMKGHVEVLDEHFSGKVPMSYGMYKMGLAVILKPKSKYQSKSQIKSFVKNDDGTGSLFFESDAQFIDPETRKLTRSVSENEYLWSVADGKLQVTQMFSKEIKKELLE